MSELSGTAWSSICSAPLSDRQGDSCPMRRYSGPTWLLGLQRQDHDGSRTPIWRSVRLHRPIFSGRGHRTHLYEQILHDKLRRPRVGLRNRHSHSSGRLILVLPDHHPARHKILSNHVSASPNQRWKDRKADLTSTLKRKGPLSVPLRGSVQYQPWSTDLRRQNLGLLSPETQS